MVVGMDGEFLDETSLPPVSGLIQGCLAEASLPYGFRWGRMSW